MQDLSPTLLTRNPANALTTIHTLPDEILDMILDLYLKHPDFRGSHYRLCHPTNPLMTITHVCARWRHHALSRPLLWSIAHIYVPRSVDPSTTSLISDTQWESRMLSLIDALETWLARSGDCPLRITLCHSEEGLRKVWKKPLPVKLGWKLVRLLLSTSYRWKEVSIRVSCDEWSIPYAYLVTMHPSRIPILEKVHSEVRIRSDLTLSEEEDDYEGEGGDNDGERNSEGSGDSSEHDNGDWKDKSHRVPHKLSIGDFTILSGPSVRDVAIHSYSGNIGHAPIVWEMLTHLSIGYPSYPQRSVGRNRALNILKKCPALVFCSLKMSDVDAEPDALTFTSPLIMQNLTDLWFPTDITVHNNPLPFLVLPALRALKFRHCLRVDRQASVPLYLQWLEKYGSQLTTFKINDSVAVSHEDLASFLEKVPNVTRLEIFTNTMAMTLLQEPTYSTKGHLNS